MFSGVHVCFCEGAVYSGRGGRTSGGQQSQEGRASDRAQGGRLRPVHARVSTAVDELQYGSALVPGLPCFCVDS